MLLTNDQLRNGKPQISYKKIDRRGGLYMLGMEGISDSHGFTNVKRSSLCAALGEQFKPLNEIVLTGLKTHLGLLRPPLQGLRNSYILFKGTKS